MSAYVYRCYDSSEAVLYVGASINVEARIAQHTLSTVWGPQIARVEESTHSDMRAALDTERDEIQRLRPRWNINGRGPRLAWGLSDYVEVILAIDGRRDSCWSIDNSDRKVTRLAAELRRRFPDVADRLLADLRPHVRALRSQQAVA